VLGGRERPSCGVGSRTAGAQKRFVSDSGLRSGRATVRGRPVVPLRCGTANVVEGVRLPVYRVLAPHSDRIYTAYDLTFTATVTRIVSLSNGS
jgi:hypothetical protein